MVKLSVFFRNFCFCIFLAVLCISCTNSRHSNSVVEAPPPISDDTDGEVISDEEIGGPVNRLNLMVSYSLNVYLGAPKIILLWIEGENGELVYSENNFVVTIEGGNDENIIPYLRMDSTLTNYFIISGRDSDGNILSDEESDFSKTYSISVEGMEELGTTYIFPQNWNEVTEFFSPEIILPDFDLVPLIGEIHGSVKDELTGESIYRAMDIVDNSNGHIWRIFTNNEGEFELGNLSSGEYLVRILIPIWNAEKTEMFIGKETEVSVIIE